MRKYQGFLFCICLWINSCSGQRGGDVQADDIGLFSDSMPGLSKAVEMQDTLLIAKILTDHPAYANYQEPKFGQTLLHWSVRTDHEQSVMGLIRHGANPNLQDTYDGESALMLASDYGPNYDTTSTVLRLLLKYGGDPNAEEAPPRRVGNTTRFTPLMKAAGCCLNKTRILIEAGADVNHVNEFHDCALKRAMIGGHDAAYITRYLLMEANADIPEYFSLDAKGNKITILNYLRDWTYDLDSDEYKVKMQIVDYLQTKGLNYWDAPIPKIYLTQYPKSYLDKY